MSDDYMKNAANEYYEAGKIIRDVIYEMTSHCPTACEQVATAILARLAHQKLLLENVDNLNRSEEIHDAAIEVLLGAYSDDEYVDARALEDLRQAVGISVEELRKLDD
jgi:hypothetical protein